MSKRQLNEDHNISCQVLLNRISKEIRSPVRSMMLEDLADKASKMMSKTAPASAKEKAAFDIAIVTVIEPELRAIKLACQIDIDAPESENINGLRYWHTTLRRKSPDREFSVLITMVGEARNIPCAIACGRLFTAFDVKACFLLGIAAGLKGKVKLGDVVAGDIILDYEHQRVEVGRHRKRPKHYEPDAVMARNLQYFVPTRSGWLPLFRRVRGKLEKGDRLPTRSGSQQSVSPEFKRGVILAGEKLIADGSLPTMREEYHEQVLAAEEEGSGFSSACKEYKVPSLVFRGISDYGDPAKRKKWQATAALAAATALVTFIRSEFRTSEEAVF